MNIQKILLALEGKENELPLVTQIFSLATQLDASVTVLRVNDSAAGKAHMLMGGLKLVTEDDLKKLLISFGIDVSNVTFIIEQSENYSKTIASHTSDFDLLAIGHHNKNIFLQMFTDSTDDKVSDLVDCPLLVISI